MHNFIRTEMHTRWLMNYSVCTGVAVAHVWVRVNTKMLLERKVGVRSGWCGAQESTPHSLRLGHPNRHLEPRLVE